METEVIAALVLLAVSLCALLASRAVAKRPAADLPRHRWAVASATTRDGVTAHLQVDYTWEPLADDDGTLAERVASAVEDAVRTLITGRTLAALPGVGDDPGWGPTGLVPEVRIEHVRVTSSEVEVTGELRRLVQDRGSG